MNLSETESEVLTLIAQDGDYESLPLLLDEFKQAHPKLSDSEAQSLASTAAKSLLARGLIEAFNRPRTAEDYKLMAPADAAKAIDRTPNWYPSERETAMVSLAPTVVGERVFRENA